MKTDGPLVPDGENLDASELGGTTKVHELWGFKSVEGLDHYAHVLNQHKLLIVG